MTLQTQILKEDDQPKFAVISYKDYTSLEEVLRGFDSVEDLTDFLQLQQVKRENTEWVSHDEMKKELGLS
ncbi:MAG: prevent-host-death family protein [Spirosomataceae bacterium]